MKKLFCYLLIGFCICSCDEDIQSPGNEVSNENEVYQTNDALKTKFGFALAKGLAESLPLRALLKEEALKMFDNDYDILYHLVKNKELAPGHTVRNLLLQYFSDENELVEIEKALPLLTIFVPELPEDSFSGALWNVSDQIPVVGVAYSQTSDIGIINELGEKYMMPSEYIPAFPVVVIKENERVVVKNSSNKDLKDKAKRGLRSDDGIEFEFLSDSFDSTLKNNSSDYLRTTSDIDEKLKNAYAIYQSADGWQRDYIYYNITPNQTSGAFVYDFAEYISAFRFIGDPINVYSKIADQTGDPKLTHRKKKSGGFTEGFYEFKVQLLYNSKNGLGEARTAYFPASPYSLFLIEYDRLKLPIVDDVYIPKIVGFKTINPRLFLLNWDLDDYASSIKIEIEEVDVQETFTASETRTVKFASNFEITGNVLKKVGLKFGASLEQTVQQTTSKSYTLGNDLLGNVIVNFGDKVILNTGTNALGYTTYTTREYESGYFAIGVEPKRVQ